MVAGEYGKPQPTLIVKADVAGSCLPAIQMPA